MNTLLQAPWNTASVAPTRWQGNPPPRILVVEDDGDLRQLNTLVLVRFGYQADAAEDGEVAWEALHAQDYDLLITDHRMPKVSGLDLVEKVRSAHMTLPVVLAAGALPPEEVHRTPWLQLAATLVKPFSPDELLRTVQDVLRAAA